MFYMPGTRMLFGDARVTTEGKTCFLSPQLPLLTNMTDSFRLAIKSAIEARIK